MASCLTRRFYSEGGQLVCVCDWEIPNCLTLIPGGSYVGSPHLPSPHRPRMLGTHSSTLNDFSFFPCSKHKYLQKNLIKKQSLRGVLVWGAGLFDLGWPASPETRPVFPVTSSVGNQLATNRKQPLRQTKTTYSTALFAGRTEYRKANSQLVKHTPS